MNNFSDFHNNKNIKPSPVGVLVFIITLIFIGGPIFLAKLNIFTMETFIFWVVVALFVTFGLGGLRVINQYERGVILTFGKYTSTRNPGLMWIFIGVQRMIKVDIRVNVIDVPDQDAITRDNISIKVNAVVYYKVQNAKSAVIEIVDYRFAISQLAQTTMRDIVGEMELDGLLAKRDSVSKKIRGIVDEASDPWGISVVSVELKHIELPEDLKRVIGKQAEAERERRSVIIKAAGERTAAENLSKAAQILAENPGALHLRTLQTLNELSSDQSNTVVFAMPIEVLRAFSKLGKSK